MITVNDTISRHSYSICMWKTWSCLSSLLSLSLTTSSACCSVLSQNVKAHKVSTYSISLSHTECSTSPNICFCSTTHLLLCRYAPCLHSLGCVVIVIIYIYLFILVFFLCILYSCLCPSPCLLTLVCPDLV